MLQESDYPRGPKPEEIDRGGFRLNLLTRRLVVPSGAEVDLSAPHTSLVAALMIAEGIPIGFGSNRVDISVNILRKKLPLEDAKRLRTIYREGYILDLSPEEFDSGTNRAEWFGYGPLKLGMEDRRLTYGFNYIPLTESQTLSMSLLIRKGGKIVANSAIMEESHIEGSNKALRAHISRLNTKLKAVQIGSETPIRVKSSKVEDGGKHGYLLEPKFHPRIPANWGETPVLS